VEAQNGYIFASRASRLRVMRQDSKAAAIFRKHAK
jgi:hypothetical protein